MVVVMADGPTNPLRVADQVDCPRRRHVTPAPWHGHRLEPRDEPGSGGDAGQEVTVHRKNTCEA